MAHLLIPGDQLTSSLIRRDVPLKPCVNEIEFEHTLHLTLSREEEVLSLSVRVHTLNYM